MKKKMLAMFLACAMIVPTSAFCVMAEEETEAAEETAEEASGEVTEINWSDLEEQMEEADLAGDFYALGESGLQMWLSDSLISAELSEEDTANGYIAYLQNADQTCTLSIQYASVDEEITLDDYVATLEESGAENIEYVLLNGLNAVTFDFTENDSSGIAIETEDGEVVLLGFAPASDDEFASAVTIMAASVQTNTDAEDDASEEEAADEEVVEEETEEAE